MTRTLLAGLAALSACGPDTQGFEDCGNGITVETPGGCPAATDTRARAEQLLATVGLSAGLPAMHVLDAYVFECGGEWVAGCQFADEVWVGRGALALVHEMLHVYDFQHARLGSHAHDGWEPDGYYGMSDYWVLQGRDSIAPMRVTAAQRSALVAAGYKDPWAFVP